jgi:ATP-binding cassette subfamily B (MDR/TAP) protein 8
MGSMPLVYLLLNLYGGFLRQLSRTTKDLDSWAAVTSDEVYYPKYDMIIIKIFCNIKAISNIRTVRAFVAEGKENDLYQNAIAEASTMSTKLGFHIGAFQGMTNLAIGVMTLSIMYIGGIAVINKEMSGGHLMSYMIITETATKSLCKLP